MAGKPGASHPAANEDFPILNRGQSEITHFLRDGPACSKLLVGSLQTGYHHFSVAIFIATADAAVGVGKSAAPKSPWTSVTHIPEEFRELWVATDKQTETVVLQEGFLIAHPPSGVLVAGSNNRMRAAMTRQLEPLTLHTKLPRDDHAPMSPPHFEAYLTTTRRMQFLGQLIQQALAPQIQPGPSPPTLSDTVQPMKKKDYSGHCNRRPRGTQGTGHPAHGTRYYTAVWRASPYSTPKRPHLCSQATSTTLSRRTKAL